jgi:hypothetical protein
MIFKLYVVIYDIGLIQLIHHILQFFNILMCMIYSERDGHYQNILILVNVPLIPGPMPPGINADDDEFNIQVGPPYQHNVDYDECP